MQIHTYRVRSLAEAIRVVREELGPDAALLHTRQVGAPLLRWLGGRNIEVTASPDANVPSRLPDARDSASVNEADVFRATVKTRLQAVAAGGISLVESSPLVPRKNQ